MIYERGFEIFKTLSDRFEMLLRPQKSKPHKMTEKTGFQSSLDEADMKQYLKENIRS